MFVLFSEFLKCILQHILLILCIIYTFANLDILQSLCIETNMHGCAHSEFALASTNSLAIYENMCGYSATTPEPHTVHKLRT